jgi:ligand-binding sensor domain-containing protein/signal transduction histidine kinase
MIRHPGLVAVLLLSALPLDGERLPLRSYTVADGLAQNTINRIYRDNRGFLWFCTAEGLSRFDGAEFTTFGTDQGLPHRNVNDVLETRSGAFWIATSAGVARLGETVTIVSPPGSPGAAHALAESPDGTVWVGTGNGLYRLSCAGDSSCVSFAVETGIETLHPAHRSVFDLEVDRDGNLWVATAVGVYRRSRDGTTRALTTRDGLPDDFVHALLEDRRGGIWVGTRHRGVFRLRQSADSIRADAPIEMRTANGHSFSWISDMLERADGTLWIAGPGGVVTFDPARHDGGTIRAFGTPHGLTDHGINALAEDGSGNLWMGTETAGALKLARNGFQTFAESDGILGANAVFGDEDGDVCVRANLIGDRGAPLVEGGVLAPGREVDRYWIRFGRFDGQRWTWIYPRAIGYDEIGWVGERITLRARTGEWWIGSGIGVFRFPAVPFEGLATAEPIAVYRTAQVFSLFEDRHGDVWISTAGVESNRVFRWRGGTAALEEFSSRLGAAALAAGPARAFGEDAAGNLWIGLSRGAARVGGDRVTRFDERHGLPASAVNHIHRDRSGRLWMALSAGGVVRLDDAGGEAPRARTYTTADGLSSNLAIVLTEDRQGRIYVGTGRGLDQLDPRSGRIRQFTTADGLAAGRILSAFCDRNGTIWVGVSRGISRLDPEEASASPPPDAMITALSVAGAARRVPPRGARVLAIEDLQHSENHVQVHFTAPAFATGGRVRFRHRLDGASPGTWSGPATARSVNYAQLVPGRYVFSVEALPAEGSVAGRPATVTFTIVPPVWRRWWFTSLLLLAAAAIGFAAYRYRVGSLVEVANVRANIASDLHDDIGANLTRIAILSEVARRQPERGADPLASIGEIARESVSAMSDIVWAIHPERDHFVDLVRRMRRHAEEVASSSPGTLSFRADDADGRLRIGPAQRRALFLIFKEAVNNAARHAHYERLEIDLAVDGRWLRLRVRDDGRGYAEGEESAGLGLASMKRRAAAVGGSLEVTTRPGAGTSVDLCLRA